MSIQPVATPGASAQAYAEQPARSIAPRADTASLTPNAPPTQVASAASATAPSIKQVQEAVQKTQEFLQNKANNLVFSLDKDCGEMVVKVIDANTDEVIRQIPSREMLELAHSLEEFQNTHGVLLKSKA